MANITQDNSTYVSGTNDTTTTLTNDNPPSLGDEIVAEHFNGMLSAVVGIEAVLGNALELKGSKADVAARLNTVLDTNGKLKDFSASTCESYPVPLAQGGLGATIGSAGVLTSNVGADGNATALTSSTTKGDYAVNRSGVPTGTVMYMAAQTTPRGWLSCDGSLVSRTTYSLLFSIIGTNYGAGDGSTTFKLPDYRGRSLVGAQTGITALYSSFGEEGHTLTINEMPAHTHNNLNLSTSGATSSGNTTYLPGVLAATSSDYSTTSTGSGVPFNMMNPFVVLHAIIKY